MEQHDKEYRPGRSGAVLALAMLLFGLRTAASQGAPVDVSVSAGCRELHETVVAQVKSGRLAEAERMLSSELARGSGPDCAGLILTNLAATVAFSGRHREAETLAERAIAFLEKDYSPEDRALLRPLQILAATRIEQGKIARAREAYQRLRRVRIERPEDAALVHGIAGTLFQIGRKWREAEEEFLAATRSWEAAGLGEKADAVAVLASLATVYAQERQLDDASKILERALVILQNAADTLPTDRANLLNVRAEVRFLQHDFRQAELDAREAVAVAEREPQSSVSLRAVLLVNYAQILRKNGRNREARALETRAAVLRRDRAPENVIDVTELAGVKTAR